MRPARLSARFFSLLAVVILVVLALPKQLESANLTSVKDTLSSSRLSYVGALGTGNTAGSSVVTLKTSSLPGWATSDDNLNLFTGDSLMIGTTNNYTVIDLVGTTAIEITAGLGTNDAQENDPVIATRSAQHTVTFTPVSQINNGYYRIRIKATSGTQAQSKDGIPDADGFDFTTNFQTSYISCPDSGTASIEYSGDTHCPSGYTCVFCNYSGVNSLAQKTLNIGTATASQQPINPAPSSTGKTAGEADTYTFYVDHLDSSYNLIDSTQGKIAVIESVRVTATVDPTITFTITGVGVGNTACGVPVDVTATATSVPFGSLTLGAFNNAAQQLSCITNAVGGYAVTAIESDQLNRIISTGLDTSTSIADTDCDGGSDTCNESDTAADWVSDNSTSGFGFSLEDIDSSKIAFEYDATDCSGSNFTTDVDCSACAGNYCAMRFPATADGGESALTLFKNTSLPTTTEDIYVCYRVAVATTQTAGDYTNSITYVASATF